MIEQDKTERAVGVVYLGPSSEAEPEHKRVMHLEIAKKLAALQGLPFEGDYDPAAAYSGPLYFVPTETITDLETAHRLGIDGEDNLFGGVVSQAFMATKAVTHPLLGRRANTPEGWPADFGDRIGDSVLPGLSAFSAEDAHEAGLRLLERGRVRIKPVRATAGRGQSTVSSREALAETLAGLDRDEISHYGLVLEEHLDEVTTYSVGLIQVGNLVGAYYGTQNLTTDNEGETVYGGSDLLVVRGGFQDLLDLDMPDDARLAVSQAQAYDRAASDCLAGFFASRRNYDVAQGIDTQGERRSGVLEQSWRIGGASSAEVAALEAFRSDPAIRTVRASSLERYGEDQNVPDRATILFRGRDEAVGFMTKYVMVEADDNKQ